MTAFPTSNKMVLLEVPAILFEDNAANPEGKTAVLDRPAALSSGTAATGWNSTAKVVNLAATSVGFPASAQNTSAMLADRAAMVKGFLRGPKGTGAPSAAAGAPVCDRLKPDERIRSAAVVAVVQPHRPSKAGCKPALHHHENCCQPALRPKGVKSAGYSLSSPGVPLSAQDSTTNPSFSRLAMFSS